ncbi:MAG TPA: Wzz/FepE/Etk N-terminal domain-containing protein [Gemmatimonadaceae bacterium]|nr:Wzz/FepE/Etk N-terminal domain-containing protein [Gemmatimonadaceae bacterium]
MSTATPDTIDLADVARSVRRGWRVVLGSIGACLVLAVLVILFGPRRFEGKASAIVRSADPSSSLLSRIGGDAMGGLAAGAGALFGGGGAQLETEIQILQSKSVLGEVVDSLKLQVQPREPSGLPATKFVRDVRLPGSFEPVDLDFERTAAGQYKVTGDGVNATATAGGALATPAGTIALRDSLPASFSLRLVDRQDAVARVGKSLNVKKAGGEVLAVSYRAPDSITAAAVPNVAMSTYLARKKTSDRGVNAHRVEFLSAQLDTTALQLATAEQALRQFQERSGLLDPEVMGKLELEQAADLRKSLGEVEVEQGALDQMLTQVAAGHMTKRQLAAFPAFLKSAGINDLLSRISELETQRTKLLETRLETDRDVVALDKSISDLESQLVPLGKAYSGALQRQRTEIEGQLGTMAAQLEQFPGEAQTSGRLVREVKRLGLTYAALQTQLVEARLSAIAEGGDIRALDVATVPKRVAFPNPVITTAAGLGAGLVIGLLLALVTGSHGRYLEGPYAIERAAGVPALRFDPRTPLLMSGRSAIRTVLLIPVEPGVATLAVAERLADTALARGESATILDLSGPAVTAPAGASVGGLISRLEQEHSLVVVRLPGLESTATAAALSDARPVLLVAPPRRVGRRELTSAVETLRRLDVPCAGVVLSDSERHELVAG